MRLAGSLHNRLATVEAALRLQDATGTSHLQQIEINPEAYGVAKSSRPHIKRLRLQRNRALHGACKQATKPALEEEIILPTPSSVRQATKPREEETILSTPSSVRPATKDKVQDCYGEWGTFSMDSPDDKAWVKQWKSYRTSCFGRGRGAWS